MFDLEQQQIFAKKIDSIRDLMNHPYKRGLLVKDPSKFNKCFVCLDTLGDCYATVKYYSELPSIDGYNGGYMYITGLLQTLYLTTDALISLAFNIADINLNYKKSHTFLLEVRDIRNEICGHPFDRGGQYMNTISRDMISKEKIEYISYESKGWGAEVKKLNLEDFLNKAICSINDVLLEIEGLINVSIKEHLDKFIGMKYSDTLKGTGYNIQKLYEYRTSYLELVKIDLKTLKEAIEKSESQVKELYYDLTVVSGIKLLLDEMYYIISRLEDFLAEKNYSGNKDVNVFVDALSFKLDEYVSMMKGLDEEFGGND